MRAATLLLLAALGCAGQRSSQRLEEEAARFVYAAPPEKLLAQARALLEERGYTVNQEPNALALSTPWKQGVVSPGLASEARRYLVAAKELREGQTLVRIYRATQTVAGTADTTAAHGYEDGPGGGERSGHSAAPFGGPGAASAKGTHQRDLELEWQLLERVEPELAEVLRQEGAAPAPRR